MRERQTELHAKRTVGKRALSLEEENATSLDWGGCISYWSGQHYHSCLLPRLYEATSWPTAEDQWTPKRFPQAVTTSHEIWMGTPYVRQLRSRLSITIASHLWWYSRSGKPTAPISSIFSKQFLEVGNTGLWTTRMSVSAPALLSPGSFVSSLPNCLFLLSNSMEGTQQVWALRAQVKTLFSFLLKSLKRFFLKLFRVLKYGK